MFFRQWDPWTAATRRSFPALNAWTNRDEAVVTAELPGVRAEDLEIAVARNVLTLKGRRREAEGETAYHRRERAAGEFSRLVELPFAVESDKVAAKLEAGVLTVRLPRAESDKPRRIAVGV